jgi:6,7-dimethyl-8-ribityllumazine synthase
VKVVLACGAIALVLTAPLFFLSRTEPMVEARRRKQAKDAPVQGARILIVESGYYEEIAATLLAGARRALDAAQVRYDVVTVPGALEIPQAVAIALGAARGAEAYDGVVALGCVIRGETSHYDIVAGESARALLDIGVARGVPVGNGILTVDTEAQARARAGLDGGDKGGVAAAAALALVRLKRDRASPRKRR